MMRGDATYLQSRTTKAAGSLRFPFNLISLLLIGIVSVPITFAAAQPDSLLSWGQVLRPQLPPAVDAEPTSVVAGAYHNVALYADGSMQVWGENVNGQCNAPRATDFTSIAAGFYHTLALRPDGSIAAWGDNSQDQCAAPRAQGYRVVAAGDYHLKIRRSGWRLPCPAAVSPS